MIRFLKETAIVFPTWMGIAVLTVPAVGEWAGVATFPAAIALSLYVRYSESFSDDEESVQVEAPHPQQMHLFHRDRTTQ